MNVMIFENMFWDSRPAELEDFLNSMACQRCLRAEIVTSRS